MSYRFTGSFTGSLFTGSFVYRMFVIKLLEDVLKKGIHVVVNTLSVVELSYIYLGIVT